MTIGIFGRVLVKKSLLRQLIDDAERACARSRKDATDLLFTKDCYDRIRVECGLPPRDYYLIDWPANKTLDKQPRR